MTKKAVILASGGLDSTTCLAVAASEGYACYTLAFDYGQKHRAELKAAEKLSKAFGAKHILFPLPLASFGGSALTDNTIDVCNFSEETKTEIPLTYVPARNTIFLSVSLGLAETLNARDIFIGVSTVDYSNYPDCRPEYIDQFQKMANLATKAALDSKHVTIHTPLIHLSKGETIKLGLKLGVDYHETVSCYRADEKGLACGCCDSCTLRKKGFKEAGVQDATRYCSAVLDSKMT